MAAAGPKALAVGWQRKRRRRRSCGLLRGKHAERKNHEQKTQGQAEGCALHHGRPPTAGAAPAGRRIVRMISAASLSVSACNPARAAAMSCSMAARASRTCSWARVRACRTASSASLLGPLAAGFLRLEDCQARLAQALLVLLGPGFRGGYIGARFQEGPLGALATLFQDPLQRLVRAARCRWHRAAAAGPPSGRLRAVIRLPV